MHVDRDLAGVLRSRATPRQCFDLMAGHTLFLVAGKDPFGKAEFADRSRQLAGIKLEAHSEIREVEVAGLWRWSRADLTVVMTPPGDANFPRAA